MNKILKVAAAQLGPASPDKAGTVSRMVTLLDQAGRAGVEVVVFPELSLTRYFAVEILDDPASFAEASFPSAVTAPLIATIRRHNITTVVPFAEVSPGGLFNSAALLNPKLRLVRRLILYLSCEDGMSAEPECRH